MLKDTDKLTDADTATITSSGADWVRLQAGGKKGSKELTLDHGVDWKLTMRSC